MQDYEIKQKEIFDAWDMEAAVEKGSVLLDEKVPNGWAHKVRRPYLDMSVSHYHVLAWVFSSNYTNDGVRFLTDGYYTGYTADEGSMSGEERHKWEVEHGFGLPFETYNRTQEPYYDKLSACWRRQINQRLPD